MKAVSLVLAHAAQEDVNAPVSPRDNRTPLHLASSLGNLAIAQLLIWVRDLFSTHSCEPFLIVFFPFQSNANVKSIDHDGRTCVSYARSTGSQELVDLLLNNGCPDVTLSGTLPRRKNSVSAAGRKADFDKITSSVL